MLPIKLEVKDLDQEEADGVVSELREDARFRTLAAAYPGLTVDAWDGQDGLEIKVEFPDDAIGWLIGFVSSYCEGFVAGYVTG